MSLSELGKDHHVDRRRVRINNVKLMNLSIELINRAINSIRATGDNQEYLATLENEIVHRAAIEKSPLGKALA